MQVDLDLHLAIQVLLTSVLLKNQKHLEVLMFFMDLNVKDFDKYKLKNLSFHCIRSTCKEALKTFRLLHYSVRIHEGYLNQVHCLCMLLHPHIADKF